jgi:opacity protein-like surface antigen
MMKKFLLLAGSAVLISTAVMAAAPTAKMKAAVAEASESRRRWPAWSFVLRVEIRQTLIRSPHRHQAASLQTR